MKKKMQLFAFIVTTLFAIAPLAHAEMGRGEDVHDGERGGAGVTAVPVSGMHMEDGVNTASGAMMGGKDDRGEGKEKDGGEKNEMGMMGREGGEELDEDIELDIDTESLKGDDEDEVGTSTPVDSPEKVHSMHDFEHFIGHRAENDDRLTHVEVKDGKIGVEYKTPAKLFGFIPASVTAHATVDSSDTVEVTYPWYHIFMKKNVGRESLRADIARAIAAERKAEKEGVSTTTIQSQIVTALGIPDLFDIIARTLKESTEK